MKNFLVTLFLACTTILPTLAQELPDINQEVPRDKSVYLEIKGPSNLIGVSYDARFKGNNHLGYRVGVAYSYGQSEIFGLYNNKAHSFSVPIEINALVGSGKSRLELGFGTSLGYYYANWEVLGEKDSACTFGYFFYGNIGYRLTTRKGFQFRIGVTPTFNFGGDRAVDHDPILQPYLSFGYAF